MKESFHKINPRNRSDDKITIGRVGHSTVLINFFGTWILTDPVFSQRIGFKIAWLTIGPQRLVKPALTICDIPQIDIILISHIHMDHFDLPTLSYLSKKFWKTAEIIISKNNTDYLRKSDFKEIKEMDRWEKKFSKWAYITALEAKHRGARIPFFQSDRSRGHRKNGRSYNGYLIEKNEKKIIFAGDTAYGEFFKQDIYQESDVVLMPIWAYKLHEKNHVTPHQALEMVSHSHSKVILPIHHKTFKLSLEPLDEPIQLLREKAPEHDIQIWREEIGQVYELK